MVPQSVDEKRHGRDGQDRVGEGQGEPSRGAGAGEPLGCPWAGVSSGEQEQCDSSLPPSRVGSTVPPVPANPSRFQGVCAGLWPCLQWHSSQIPSVLHRIYSSHGLWCFSSPLRGREMRGSGSQHPGRCSGATLPATGRCSPSLSPSHELSPRG